MTTNGSLVRIVDLNGFPEVGRLISIELKKPNYERDLLVNTANKFGLNSEKFGPKSKKETFIDAMKAAEKDGVLQRVGEDATTISYQVSEKEIESLADGTKRANFDAKIRVVYSKLDDKIVCNDPEFSKRVEALMITWANRYKKETVRRYVQEWFDDARKFAHNVRADGRFQFVKAADYDFLDQVEKFLAVIDPGALKYTPIPDVSSSQNLVAQAYETGAEQMVAGIAAKVQTYIDEGKEMSKRVFDNIENDLLLIEMEIENGEQISKMKLDQKRLLLQEQRDLLAKHFSEHQKTFKKDSKEPSQKKSKTVKVTKEQFEKIRELFKAGTFTKDQVIKMTGLDPETDTVE